MVYLLCYKIYLWIYQYIKNFSSSSAFYMLQFELFITWQTLLSSCSSFSNKRNAEVADKWCSIPSDRPIFSSTKSAHQWKEAVEIAEIAEHNKENNQRNTNTTRSWIRFSNSSPEALVGWLLWIIWISYKKKLCRNV